MSLILALGVVIAPSLVASEASAQTKDDEKGEKTLDKGLEKLLDGKDEAFSKRVDKVSKICDDNKDGTFGVQTFPEFRCHDN